MAVAKNMPKGHCIAALVMGVMELLLSLIVIIIAGVLSSKADLPSILTPFWAAIPYIIPGILGLVVFFTKNKCAMIAFMVLNLLCLIICGLATILVALVIGIYAAVAGAIGDYCNYDSVNKVCRCTYKGSSRDLKGVGNCDVYSEVSSLLYCIVAFLVIAVIVTFASSILGCVGSCCTNQPAQNTTVIIQQAPVQVLSGKDEYNQGYKNAVTDIDEPGLQVTIHE